MEHSIWNDSVLPQLKEVYPDVREVHSIVLQNVVHQVRDNINAISEKKKKGRRVGRLRHKPRPSMIFEQTGFKIDGSFLRLSRIEAIPIAVSRPIEGTIKQIIIKHNKTHNWLAIVVSKTNEIDDWFSFRRTYQKSLKLGMKSVGIDLNVSNFSTDSDGLVIEHPKNVKKAEKRLIRQQRKLSQKTKGSCNRKKQKLIVAKVHEKVDNRRNDFLHKTSRYYVNNYDLIALEDLSIAELVHKSNTGMAKAILDASWGKFMNYVLYKAENAGKYTVQVIAKGTTQDCSVCGKTVPKDLSVRTHSCPYCGSVMPRDYNSSLNIKLKGMEMVGCGTPEPTPLNFEKLNTLAEIRTSILDINNPEQVFTTKQESPAFRLESVKIIMTMPEIDANRGEEKLLILPLGEESKKITQVISNDTARQVIELLADAPLSASDISERLHSPISTIVYNLENLEDVGLIRVDKIKYSEKGREVKIYAPVRKLIVVVPEKTDRKSVTDLLRKYMGVILAAVLASSLIEFFTGRMGSSPRTSQFVRANSIRLRNHVSNLIVHSTY